MNKSQSQSLYNKEYYQKNKEKHNQYYKDYYKQHRETEIARSTQYIKEKWSNSRLKCE